MVGTLGGSLSVLLTVPSDLLGTIVLLLLVCL
jgi:hypothetical protein